MYKLTFFLLLLLSISCTTENQPVNLGIEAVKNDKAKPIEEAFGIEFQIEKLDDEYFNLITAIELDSGSYIISPYSQDTTYSPFDISIQETDKLTLDGLILETPASFGEYDPILDQMVNFVRHNTTYTQKIKLTAQGDFEVYGLAWLLLEPSCVPYDVAFQISYRDGVMRIHKTKTSISKGYKL